MPRGSPATDLKPSAFVLFLQNHDQVANSATGCRIHELTTRALLRAMTALLLLAPGTPMLFQGQEFAASSPFPYFADNNPELAPLVQDGRHTFLKQFPSIKETELALPVPHNPATFEASKLDLSERAKNKEIVALHRDLIRLRREDAVFREQRADWMHGAVLSSDAFVLRFFGKDRGDRLILTNLGRDLPLVPAPEPLLAPPPGAKWKRLWSSESPAYGGSGQQQPIDNEGIWFLSGESTTVLASES
jgi:maltooligosyltrehalose trehalohydrolase